MAALESNEILQQFTVKQWEAWHLYSFYLNAEIDDMEEAANRLAAAGLIRCFVLPDGKIGWGTKELTPPVERDTFRSKETEISYLGHAPEELKVPLFKLLSMRSAERHVFGVASDVPEPSLRVYFPSITVDHPSGRMLPMEVMGQIFQPGIVLISLIASVELEVGLDEFIRDHVNLSELNIGEVRVQGDLAYLFFCALEAAEEQPFRSRWPILKERKKFHLDTEKQARLAKDGPPEAVLNSDKPQHLAEIAQAWVQAVAYCLGKIRGGVGFLLLGEPKHPRWKGRWHGSPHIHLIEFAGQTDSAEENERNGQYAFSRILSRSSPVRIPLPQNLRAFDDHSVYIGESAILWVYSTAAGKPQALDVDGKVKISFPTCHNQVKGELIEYKHTLYNQMLDELTSRNFAWDQFLAVKERQLLFELNFSLTGQFGEIRDLLREAFRVRRIEELQASASSLIDLRETHASVNEDRRLALTATLIGFILAVLGLGDAVDFIRRTIKPYVPGFRDLAPSSPLESTTLGLTVLALLSLFSWLVHFLLGRRYFISKKKMRN